MKKLWLDLEIKEEVNDYIALVYALEKKLPISVVSLKNPTVFEYHLVAYTICIYNRNIPLVINGKIKEHNNVSNYTLELISYHINSIIDDCYPKPIFLNDFIKDYPIEKTTVFCCSSLNTLSILVSRFDNSLFDSIVQSGSYFNNIETLDIEAANIVLESKIHMKIISNNIFNNLSFSKENIGVNNNLFNAILNIVISHSSNSEKYMNNLLALSVFEKNSFIEFKRVLFCINNNNKEWEFKDNKDSNHEIAIKCNLDYFYNKIKEI